MSKYETINCECGKVYATKEFASKCPNCNKTNWSSSSGLVLILIIVGLVVFLGIMVGAIGWLFYAKKNNLAKWHILCATLLGFVLVAIGHKIFSFNEYPILASIMYLTNGISLVYGSFLYWKISKGN